PPPSIELPLVALARRKIDLALRPFEARREPELLLSAIPPFPSQADQLLRKVVQQPIPGAAEDADAANPGLLKQLAARRGFRLLAFVEAPLRHLPPLPLAFWRIGALGAPSHERAALAVEQHDADARAIWQPVFVRHGRSALALRANRCADRHENEALALELAGPFGELLEGGGLGLDHADRGPL